jgi:hypothetical protein
VLVIDLSACRVVVARASTLSEIHSDAIQLCYAPAAQYIVEHYSVPSDDRYMFNIPLTPQVVPR